MLLDVPLLAYINFSAQKGSSSLQIYERQLAALNNGINAEQMKLSEAEEQLAKVTKEKEDAESVYKEVSHLRRNYSPVTHCVDKLKSVTDDQQIRLVYLVGNNAYVWALSQNTFSK